MVAYRRVSALDAFSLARRQRERRTHGKRMCRLMTSSLTKSDCMAAPSTGQWGAQNGVSVTPSRGQAVSVIGSSFAPRYFRASWRLEGGGGSRAGRRKEGSARALAAASQAG